MAVSRCQKLAEKLTLFIFLLMIVSVFSFELIIIRPYLLVNGCQLIWLYIIIGMVMLTNVLGYLYKCCRTDTSIIGVVMPSTLLPEWTYCYICECNTPPRSYHCKICDRCILKRDHHCVFTACCIGYKNYRYFFGLLFSVFIGCLFATFLHWSYIQANLITFHWFVGIWAHFTPIAFYMLGLTDLWVTTCNIVSMICIVGILFSAGMIYHHVRLVLNNQTGWEHAKQIKKYRLKDWRRNIEQSLGTRWWITVFITPYIESHLLGDGLSFPTATDDKKNQTTQKPDDKNK